MSEFTWIDGERLIRFGDGALEAAPSILAERGFDGYALLAGSARPPARPLAAAAEIELFVSQGPVPVVSRAILDEVGDRPVVAFGGGRVIDSAKAIAGVRGLRVAAIPTTLSGAEMTPFHRLPEGFQGRMLRPELVVADVELMTSQPPAGRAASAMNGLAHAVEALYTPLRNPVAESAALRAAELFARALEPDEALRPELALAATLAGYASGSAGLAVHHVVCQTLVRIGGTAHAPTNAVMLPHSLRLMSRRAPEALGRLALALGMQDADPALAAERVASLASRAELDGLASIGFDAAKTSVVVDQVLSQPALQNTPQPPGRDELERLIASAL